MGRILPDRPPGKLLSTCFFFLLCTGYSTLFGNSTFSYEELLRQAREEVFRQRYDQALQKLEIADSVGEPKTGSYYEIEGRAWIGKGDLTTALESFEKSLALDPNHPSLLSDLILGYEELRKPDKAFQFVRLGLSQNPENPVVRYKALVLSSRLGNLNYFRQTLRWIGEHNPYKDDLPAIEAEIKQSFESGKIDDTISKCSKFIPHFPENPLLHRMFLLSLKKKRFSTQIQNGSFPLRLEQALLDRAAVFRNEPIFAYESALEFLQNKRWNDALALARRAFFLNLKKDGRAEKEILYPIHRIYRQRGMDLDVQAIEILQEIVESGRSVDAIFLDSKLKQTGFNRELLLYSLAFLKYQKRGNSHTQTATWRDSYSKLRKQQEEEDLSHVVSPFALDPEESEFLYGAPDPP
ncbi:hypothetical protein EHQ12_02080 [Leptospira gomenensis]|uniref:Uncharacterized protein n=2 Tax=Leptospira gomenensis TaxID=2484974 RepID=A0A5F1YGX1_9LEPT|nr:hypothetical protein EHQ17_13975 [Leptospira gomenensis]TGK44164.1 hypothetical protein EHQ12_02080 [Leptospira gomenensis]TGK46219.1 hypothetical protein EHQ07_07210 [Leptospira gomenensis]TGK54744.1 hypothetical protein EHQ13_18800 [Leptospira gomenensis]